MKHTCEQMQSISIYLDNKSERHDCKNTVMIEGREAV